MRPSASAAALCAAVLTLAPAARAGDDVPQPVSRTVIEPPAAAAAAPAPLPAPAPLAPRSELGFSVRMGAAEADRFLLGGSFGGASGPFLIGLSADGTFDVRGTGHHDGPDHDRWCVARADGRCSNRADLTLAGYLGLRHRTGPILGGGRLRLELAGELGWQWSYVDERLSDGSGGEGWSDGARAFPIAGVRGQLGVTVFRHATFGIGGYARQGLRGKVCVTTDGGCTRVGGTTAGIYFFGGGDWGLGG